MNQGRFGGQDCGSGGFGSNENSMGYDNGNGGMNSGNSGDCNPFMGPSKMQSSGGMNSIYDGNNRSSSSGIGDLFHRLQAQDNPNTNSNSIGDNNATMGNDGNQGPPRVYKSFIKQVRIFFTIKKDISPNQKMANPFVSSSSNQNNNPGQGQFPFANTNSIGDNRQP